MAEARTQQSILKITLDSKEAIKAIGDYQEEVAKTQKAIDSLKNVQKALDKQYEDGAISKAEYTEQSRKTTDALNAETATQKALKTQMRQVEYQLQKNIQQNAENEGSLKSLRGQLSQLTAQYDNLSASERNNDEVGGKLREQIAGIYNQISLAEQETGRFQRNVGNYSMKIVDGFSAMGGGAAQVVGNVNNLKTSVLALQTASGWIGLAINIVLALVNAVKKNENAMNGLRVAMAPLAALGTAINKVLEKMGDWLGKVATKLATLAKRLGLYTEAMEEEQELTASEIALAQKRRDALVQNAEAERAIADLKAKAAQKDKYNATQRIKFWEEIGEKEKEVARREKEIAEEEYRIFKIRAARAANDKETNDKLAELQAAAIAADSAYLAKVREVNAQLAKARKEEAAGAKEVAQEEQKQTEDAQKAVDARLEIYSKEIALRLEMAEKGSLEEQALREEQLRTAYEQEMEKLQAQEGTEELQLLTRQKFDADMLALQEEYFNAEQEALAAETDAILEELQREAEGEAAIAAFRKETQIATAGAIGDAVANLGSLMEAFGDKDKRLAKVAKVLALAKIAVETGVATAQGIAQSQSVPFPANIAAIASTIATIAGGMASAVSSVKSAKFARGGLVQGAGTGTSDSIPARLSDGESVITARATSMFAPVLSAINQLGGGNAIPTPGGAETEALEGAIARGMAGANLSVSVTEIESVQAKVNGIKSRANV